MKELEGGHPDYPPPPGRGPFVTQASKAKKEEAAMDAPTNIAHTSQIRRSADVASPSIKGASTHMARSQELRKDS